MPDATQHHRPTRRRFALPWQGVVLAAAFVGWGLYLLARYDQPVTLGLAALGAVALLLVTWCLSSRGPSGGTWGFAAALCVGGLAFLLAFTPGTVPDEQYHYNASYKYADVLLGRSVGDDFITMRADDAALEKELDRERLDRSAYDFVASNATPLVRDASLVRQEVDSSYDFTANLPQQKLASVLGIALGQVLGLGSVVTFYLGRLCSLALYGALAIAAVRLIPLGKNLIAAVALLPMSLHVAASYSYDGPTLGLALLFVSLLVRAVRGGGLLEGGELVALGVTALLLAPCKVVYVLLLFGIFLVPRKRFASVRQEWLLKVGVILLAFAAIFLLRLPTFLEASGMAQSGLDVRDGEAGSFYTVGGLLAEPVKTALLFLRSCEVLGAFWLETMVGGRLAWFQEELITPLWLTLPLFLLLGLSCVEAPDDRGTLTRCQRAVMGAVFVAVFGALLVTFATTYTFDDELVILGLQGRYLLPALPCALLAIRGTLLSSDRPMGPVVAAGLCATSLFTLLRLVSLALTL